MGGEIRKSQSVNDISPAVTTVTGAYAGGWQSAVYGCEDRSTVDFLLTLDMADAVTVTLKVQLQHQDGDTFRDRTKFNGMGDIEVDELPIKAADQADPSDVQIVLPAFRVNAATALQVLAKKSGGAGSPTLSLSVAGGVS